MFKHRESIFEYSEFFVGSASTKTTSALEILNPSDGIIISSSTAFLTSIAVLITNEYT